MEKVNHDYCLLSCVMNDDDDILNKMTQEFCNIKMSHRKCKLCLFFL